MLRRLYSSAPHRRMVSSLVDTHPTYHNTNVIIADFREEKNSLIKEMFRGSLPKTLTYPDVLPNDAYFTLQEDLKDTSNFPSILNRCVTEIASIWGNVTKPDSLSSTESLMGIMHHFKDPLEAYGNSRLKTQYMASILEQSLQLGFCLFDEGISFDPSDANLYVQLNEQEDSIVLNGRKSSVFLGHGQNVDAYLLFGHSLDENKLMSILVPSGSPGVTVKPCKGLLGYENMHFAHLDLNNVTLSRDCLLSESGEEVVQKGMLSSDLKIYRAARLASVLRSLLDEAIRHAHHSSLSDSPLSDSKIVRNKVSGIASKIYALESMIYITAGLADFQKTPDYKLDATSVKLYADSLAQEVVKEVFDILGGRSTRTGENWHSASRQLSASSLSEDDNHFLHIYLGTMALSDVSEHPPNHSGLINKTKHLLNLRQISKKKDWRLTHPILLLKHKVHPSFDASADIVENAVIYLNGSILRAIEDKMTEDNETLHRIGKGGSLVHSMLAALSRASNAYCIGLRHADLDKVLCQAYIYECDQVLRRLLLSENTVPPRPYAKCIFEVLEETSEFVSSHPLDGSRML